MELDLTIAQRQHLALTHEMRQGLLLLQLPVMELGSVLQRELEENPLLESAGPSPTDLVLAATADVFGARENVIDPAGEGEDLHDLPADPDSLQQHLKRQLRDMTLPGHLHRTVELLIDSLDANGYLRIELDEAARLAAVPEGDVRHALEILQGFDPIGVGARSPAECLLLQWRNLGDDDPLVPALIEGHLPDLARGCLGVVARRLGVSTDRVRAGLTKIRRLDPKPGRAFGSAQEIYPIVPDLFVEKAAGGYVVRVNEAPVPRLRISPVYREMMETAPRGSTLREFLDSRSRRALWLLRNLERRKASLQKIGEAIVHHQRSYLEWGSRALRPLTLRAVADEVGLHESTVSRAVAGKWIQTPRGTLALKSLFPTPLPAAGSGVSTDAAQEAVAEIVRKENPDKPLSDAEIALELQRRGIHVARRTVAKYRRELGIPSSQLRIGGLSPRHSESQ